MIVQHRESRRKLINTLSVSRAVPIILTTPESHPLTPRQALINGQDADTLTILSIINVVGGCFFTV